jgi:hypothetical protein
MDQYRSFDQLRTNELSVIRHGFWRPWFELTDGQFCYGKLSYNSLWKTASVLESAQKTWIVKRKGIFSRALLINDVDGMLIGTITPEIWSRKTMLNLDNGFEAVYLNKKIFTRTLSLINTQYGDLLNIKTESWKLKTPFKIFMEPAVIKNIPNLPLLALLGVNLVLQSQERAAASAGVGG